MTDKADLSEAEQKEHENCCENIPVAWERKETFGPRYFIDACKRHGVTEEHDMRNNETVDMGRF